MEPDDWWCVILIMVGILFVSFGGPITYVIMYWMGF